ncbi:uncharacterized protein MAM_06139 [Metarhizium album ARSEF 1941]|uniref:Cell wall protein PhiA n=1 Tax=Metarhizium album (strain ARSEF 1941) TaxID=1081103 RepID=A0A0B2WQX9_METAS|nr:uncharacterized protein MAM_06139 [Metarhizium album ARSEF 1941]KHN96034.1 hypothetical protein MAM_06139 [Metarhizium album ARSEF 1941]
MPASIKCVLTAILAMAMAAHSSLASPAGMYKQDAAGSRPDTREVPSGIQYGGCYTIQNSKGETLGHQPSDWNYLAFGPSTKPVHFRVCQSVGQCLAPNTYYQKLMNRARFWLFDVEGNAYTPKGALVAANSPKFGYGGNLYAAAGEYQYYVNFWGENDCADPDNRLLGQCAVKLRIDNLWYDKGLVVQGPYLKSTASKDSFVVVTFREDKCPSE